MRYLLPLAMMLLEGCQYDPHGNLYLTTEPKIEDIVGTYILERFDLPPQTSAAPSDVEVGLHADGTFVAKNVPPRTLAEPDGQLWLIIARFLPPANASSNPMIQNNLPRYERQLGELEVQGSAGTCFQLGSIVANQALDDKDLEPI